MLLRYFLYYHLSYSDLFYIFYHLNSSISTCSSMVFDLITGTFSNSKSVFPSLSGILVIQVLNGCEWDDETEEVNGFGLISFNGEDILILDMKAQRWIATKPQLLRSQHKWNNDKSWSAL